MNRTHSYICILLLFFSCKKLSAQLHTGSFTNNFAFSNSVLPGGGTNSYTNVDGTTITFQFSWNSDPPSLSTIYDTGSYSGLPSGITWMTSGMGSGSHTLTISLSGSQDVTDIGFDLTHITYGVSAGDRATISALTASGASITPTYTQPTDPDYTLSGNTADAFDYDSAPEYNLGINLTASTADPIASVSITWSECSTCGSGSSSHGIGVSDIEFTVDPTYDEDGDGVSDNLDLDDDNDGISDADESCTGTPPTTADIEIQIQLDNYGEETSWTLSNSGGTVASVSQGTYASNDNQLISYTYTGVFDDYTFRINDSYGDGICCTYGTGYFEIFVDGVSVLGGSGNGNFGSSSTNNFTTSLATFYCLNGDPTGDDDGDGTRNYLDADFCALNGNGVCSSLDDDGDGIINSFDTDSDGDGCPDAMEGGGSYTDSDLDANDRLTATVDSDGIPGGSTQSLGNSQNSSESGDCVDTDGDGINDVTDLDDDNDGISDVDEFCTGTPPTTADIEIQIQLDSYGEEVSWTLSNTGGTVASVAQGTYASNDNQLVSYTYTGVFDEYTFIISDSYSDGICCSYGTGYYEIFVDGVSVLGGSGSGNGNYGASATENFTTSSSTFFCLDGDPAADSDGDGTRNYQDADFCTLNGNGVCSSLDDDGDGIINSMDTDSDGDGCPDAIEGGGSYTTSDLDGNDRLTATIDGDGVPGGSTQTIGNSQNSAVSSDCNTTDTDSDGVLDQVDLDDDNDGIVDGVECGSGSANLALSGTMSMSSNYNGTLVAANANDGDIDYPEAHTAGSSSNDWIELDLGSNLYVDEIVIWNRTLCCTDRLGNVYVMASTTAFPSNTVLADAQANAEYTYQLGTTDGISLLSVPIGRTTRYIRLQKSGTNPGGNWINIYELQAINYSLCDNDSDGTYDQLDLDSDDDGCSDAIEGAASFLLSGTQNDTLTGGVDTYGVPTVAGSTGQGLGESQNSSTIVCCDPSESGYTDTDGDAISDFCDLDSDNDGITDIEEGYSAIINTGTLTTSYPTGYWSIMYYEGNEDVSGSSFTGTKTFQGTSYIGVDTATVYYASNGTAANDRWNFGETPTDPNVPTNYLGSTWTSSGNPHFQLEFRRKVQRAGNLTFGSDATNFVDDVIEVFVNGTRVYGYWPGSGGGSPDPQPGGGNEISLAINADDEIEIRYMNLGGIGGLDFTFAIADEPVAIARDSDNDGILDYLDLDSDNDGIWDGSEAGHGQSIASDGRIDGASSGSGANGLFDGIETSAESGSLNYTIADSETLPDSFIDASEIDADEDGCYDTQETLISDSDADGFAGNGTPSVDANGLVTGITYAAPGNFFWQNSSLKRGDCNRKVISNKMIRIKVNN